MFYSPPCDGAKPRRCPTFENHGARGLSRTREVRGVPPLLSRCRFRVLDSAGTKRHRTMAAAWDLLAIIARACDSPVATGSGHELRHRFRDNFPHVEGVRLHSRDRLLEAREGGAGSIAPPLSVRRRRRLGRSPPPRTRALVGFVDPTARSSAKVAAAPAQGGRFPVGHAPPEQTLSDRPARPIAHAPARARFVNPGASITSSDTRIHATDWLVASAACVDVHLERCIMILHVRRYSCL